MIKIFISILILVIIFILSVVVLRLINANKNKIKTQNGIQESVYIKINGIKQYVQIRGEDKDNPVMIFIHGGPASPMGYVSSYYQKGLESKLTIINYDQRGCGRTYYANKADGKIDVTQLIDDLDAVVEYARNRFEKENVIIAGHSWGTIIASQYVQKYPEKVDRYIGISQITNLYNNKLNAARMALEKTKIKGTNDEKNLCNLIEQMSSAHKYEDMSIIDLGKLVSLTAKYVACDGEMSGLSQMWTGLTSSDMGFSDMRWFMLQMNTNKFFEQNKYLMEYAFWGFDIGQLEKTYSVPVYYISGEGDYAVCQQDAKKYFDSISAPDKYFYKIKNVGHSMFMDNREKYCNTIKDILLK